jgi:hypothetical protein
MNTLDELVRLEQTLIALERDGEIMPTFVFALQLRNCFSAESFSHLVQLIKDAQLLREGLIEAADNVDEAIYALKPLEALLRQARD